MLAVVTRTQSDPRLLRVRTSALLHQLMFSLPSGWHASHGDRGKTCPSALSVVPPLSRSTLHPPCWPAAELQCSMYHPHSVLSPPWAVHHCAPSSGRWQIAVPDVLVWPPSLCRQPMLIRRQIPHLHRDCHDIPYYTHHAWRSTFLQLER